MSKSTDPDWDDKVALSYEREARIPILRDTPGDEARDELLAMLDDVDLSTITQAATVLAVRDIESLDRLMEAWNTDQSTLESESMRNGITQLAIDGAPLDKILTHRALHGRPTVQEAAKELMKSYGYPTPEQQPPPQH